MWYLQATCSKILEKNRAERTIIGRLECFSSEVFDEKIAYTALGHLHRTQRVLRHENARYAGAPLPMITSTLKYCSRRFLRFKLLARPLLGK